MTHKKVRLLRTFFPFSMGINRARTTTREGEFEWKDYYLHQSQ